MNGVIEGETLPLKELLQDIKNNTLTFKAISQKYDTTPKRITRIAKEHGCSRTRGAWKKHDLPLYVHLSRCGNYVVQKNIRGKMKYFGTFNTVEEAEERIDYLKHNGWKK